MMKYGDSFSSNLNQGTLSLDIPFYTYSDEDFTIPISLSYHADGYRPNIQSGPEGLGWSLSASGAITREVRGIPDEEGWTNTDCFRIRPSFFLYRDGLCPSRQTVDKPLQTKSVL